LASSLAAGREPNELKARSPGFFSEKNIFQAAWPLGSESDGGFWTRGKEGFFITQKV